VLERSLSILLLLAATPTLAHRLQVFATVDGSLIAGTVHSGGWGTAAGTHILIQDASGETLAEITPAEDGNFSYKAREPMDHLIVADSGDGHRAAWRISASELAVGFPMREVEHPHDNSQSHDHRMQAADPTAIDGENPTPHPYLSPTLDPALETTIGRVLARQIIPLRQELNAERQRLRLQDILGGIGYIVGLAGLALWWRSGRSGKHG